MQKLIASLLVIACSTLSALAKPTYPPKIPGAVTKIYKIVEGVELGLYIVNPEGHQATDQRAAVVFFFGGGWNAGSPAQFAPHCAHFAEKGLVAITVDYRVASRHGVKAVRCVEDAKSAIRYVRENAVELGIDPNRIIAGGGSAGGHLAACTGTVKKFDRKEENLNVSSVPNAMMLFNPACVLAPVGDKAWDAKAKEMNARAGVDSIEISPFHHVTKGTPPTIIFHGEADTTVPFQTAEMFTDAMKKVGSRCELVGFPDMPHGFFNQHRFENKPYIQTLEKADAFLKSLGFME